MTDEDKKKVEIVVDIRSRIYRSRDYHSLMSLVDRVNKFLREARDHDPAVAYDTLLWHLCAGSTLVETTRVDLEGEWSIFEFMKKLDEEYKESIKNKE